MAYVLSHFLFLKSYRGYRIPTCPKSLPIEILLPPPKLPRHCYRALPFYIPYHFGHRMLGRYLYQHMHMILHQRPLDYPRFPLPGHFVQHRLQKFSDLSVKDPLPSFRYKCNMILAIPFRMT